MAALILERWPSSKQLRRLMSRRAIRDPGWETVHLGDLAYINDRAAHTAFLNVAIGREKAGFTVSSNRGPTSMILRLANAAVPLIR